MITVKQPYRFIFLISIILIYAIGFADASEDPRASASFYIDTYGNVDVSKSPLAKRAYSVFERVQQIAEDPIDLTPSLKIINSDGRPWAIALPDGYIILSRAALEICYQGVEPAVGDARLAFVLGHELAHLTANDFWHRKIYLSLSGKQNNNLLTQIKHVIRPAVGDINGTEEKDWRDVIKRKELQADDAGFLYASLAGFRTDLILSKEKGGDDFLEYWVSQTRTGQDDLHFNPTERSAFLQNRFKMIIAKVEYFMSGVRLAHFGRFEDAMHFFQYFQQAFPAHEVLNNLGYVHLKLARKHMSTSLRYHYWMPTLMENVPSFVVPNRSLGSALPPIAKKHLRRAIKYLSKAVDTGDERISSRINLATAFLYLDEHHKARSVIEEARNIAPQNNAVIEMRALILYEQEKEIDMWPTAIRLLKKIAVSDEPRTWYNLARLYENRGRKKQANIYWQKVVSLSHQVPAGILRIACHKIGALVSRCANTDPYQGNIPSPVNLELPAGTDIGTAAAKKYFNGWQHQHKTIGPLPVDIYIANNGNSYLAVDYQLSLAVVKNHSYKTTAELLNCCGKPISTEKLGHAELWSYGSGWSVLVDKNKVREFWISDFDT